MTHACELLSLWAIVAVGYCSCGLLELWVIVTVAAMGNVGKWAYLHMGHPSEPAAKLGQVVTGGGERAVVQHQAGVANAAATAAAAGAEVEGERGRSRQARVHQLLAGQHGIAQQ